MKKQSGSDLSDFKGDSAVVTGASEGLGLAYAHALARAGINLILVARDLSRLDAAAAAITEAYGVKAVPIAVDLSAPDSAHLLRTRVKSLGLKIRMLVNNAASGYWGKFESQAASDSERAIGLNCVAVASLCREFFEDLSSYDSSVVINVSSAASLQPIPSMSSYAASKAFVHSFSQALNWEWREHGIYVQTLVPGVMRTEFNRKIGFDVSRMKNLSTPDEVVNSSLRHLDKKTAVVWAARGVFWQKIFATFFPPKMVLREVAKIFRPTQQPA